MLTRIKHARLLSSLVLVTALLAVLGLGGASRAEDERSMSRRELHERIEAHRRALEDAEHRLEALEKEKEHEQDEADHGDEEDPMRRLSRLQRRFLKEQFPAFVDHLQQVLGDVSEDARYMAREYRERLEFLVEEMMELSEHAPAVFEIEKKIWRLDYESERMGERIRDTKPGPKREGQIAELKSMVTEAFDLKQKRRKLEAEQIEKELREISALIQQRQEHRDRIIGRRLADLTGGDELFEW
ncbi:MAG: hypothetical protein CMJ18_05235 [Phycisphaeraceae bacterium]|nr:hypothetical protein [Phycisphaeraceae bacterium]